MLALQTAPAAELELPGLRVAPFPVDSTTTQVDLELHLTPVDGGLAGGLVFDRALFERLGIHPL